MNPRLSARTTATTTTPLTGPRVALRV